MLYTNQEVSGWGNYPVVPTHMLKPKNTEDVREALAYQKNIARGLGRSYGDQAINAHLYTTSLTGLNHLLDFDQQTGILTCQAGTSLADIIRTFAPRGWFPAITPGTKFVTIGGAIANDVHGKAHHVDGTFMNCVLEINVMLADGSTVKASREEHADLFRATFGGLGLLGFVLSAKIQLKKIATTYFTKKAIKARNLEEMLEAFEQYDQDYHYSVAWIDPLAKGRSLGKGVLTIGNMASVADLPKKLQSDPLKLASEAKLGLPFYLPNISLNRLTVLPLNRIMEAVQSSKAPVAHYEQFFYPLDAIQHWNRGYGKRGFIQYQFVIPTENAVYNITKILSRIANSQCIPFLNVLKKFGNSDQGMLAFPMEGYTFAIDFPVTKHLPAFIAALDQMIMEMNGRVYLGKDAMLDAATFKAMYPHYKEWLTVKEKYDPHNLFSSNISRRLELEVMPEKALV